MKGSRVVRTIFEVGVMIFAAVVMYLQMIEIEQLEGQLKESGAKIARLEYHQTYIPDVLHLEGSKTTINAQEGCVLEWMPGDEGKADVVCHPDWTKERTDGK